MAGGQKGLARGVFRPNYSVLGGKSARVGNEEDLFNQKKGLSHASPEASQGTAEEGSMKMETKKRILRIMSIGLMLSVFVPVYAAPQKLTKIQLYRKCIARRCNEAEKAQVRADAKKAGKWAGALLLAAVAAIVIKAGISEVELYRRVAALLKGRGLEHDVGVVREEIKDAREEFNSKYGHNPSNQELLQEIQQDVLLGSDDSWQISPTYEGGEEKKIHYRFMRSEDPSNPLRICSSFPYDL